MSNCQTSDQRYGPNSQGIVEPTSTWPRGPYFMIDAPKNEESKYNNNKTLICSSQTVSPRTVPEVVASHNNDNLPITIYKFDHKLLPDSSVLQKNARAQRETKEHIVIWSYNDNVDPESTSGDDLERNGRGRETARGEYVRNLRIGEIVTVWSKSRFPGWSNHVMKVKIDMFWAV